MEKYNPEKTINKEVEEKIFYDKKAFDYLNNSEKIEEIIVPDEEVFELKDLKSEDETENLLLEELKDYLESPIIKDNFKDHEERRQWRKNVSSNNPDAFNLYDKNKIRMNKTASTLGILSIFEGKISDELKNEINKFTEKVQEIKENYNELSFDEKKNLVKELNSLSLKTYRELEKEYSKS